MLDENMEIGIILNTADSETVWNTFRFGVEAIDKKHFVKIFLLGKGVECDSVQDENFDIQKMINTFKKQNGVILACGTCLKSRQREGSNVCPISTMKDLLKLVEESDKVLTFG